MLPTRQAAGNNKFNIIKKCHLEAKKDNFEGTDDTSLAERIGYKVKILIGDYHNIKITTPEDLIIAKQLYKNYEKSNY